MPYKDNDDGLTDIYRKITPGSELHNVLCKYMLTNRVNYVALMVPSSRPTSFINRHMSRFSDRFPKEYVDDLDVLLAQGRSCPRVLVINHKNQEARMIEITSEETYYSVLFSMFVQSVQQINPTSRMLYLMIGMQPKFGLGKFVDSETNQCCFRYLVFKKKVIRGDVVIKVYVRDHVHHKSLLDLSSVSKWFNCETDISKTVLKSKSN